MRSVQPGSVRGALHGVPILLKDNIGTGDRLHTTAGAAALSSARSDRDAHLVAGLREAGAIILGKTNLSEWAYWMAYVAPSGFSALGGQVVSPYGAGIDPVRLVDGIGGGRDHESGGDHRRHRDRGLDRGALGESIGRRHAALAGAGEPRPGRSHQR